MEYFLNLPGTHFNKPAQWAKEMEAQGWDGICASDHILVGTNPYPHVFVTTMAMAAATDRILLTSSFANNLFRSPVEFAQAALTLQEQSGGRFEAGLGAGWAEHEMRAMGLDYPVPRDRVGMYVEALAIVRDLLETGQCTFKGEYYNIDVSGEYKLGPLPDKRPPLVASAGGPRNIRESTPLVDRIEIKASAKGTRGGNLDLPALATVTEDEVKKNVDRVKSINADIPVGLFIMIGAGESPMIAGLKEQFGNGYLGNFLGHAEDVARELENLSKIGIDRVQLTEFAPDSQENLRPLLIQS